MIDSMTFYNQYNANSPYNPNRNSGSFMMRKVFRELAHPIAYICAKYDYSANFITFLMLAFYISSSLLLLSTNLFVELFSMAFFAIGDLLDCVDGQLARFHGTTSELGDVLDTYIHTLSGSFFSLVFGIKLFMLTGYSPVLIIGSLGAMAYLFDAKWRDVTYTLSGQKSVSRDSSSLNIKSIASIIDTIPLLMGTVLVLQIIGIFTHTFVLLHSFFYLFTTTVFAAKILRRLVLIFAYTSKVHTANTKGWIK